MTTALCIALSVIAVAEASTHAHRPREGITPPSPAGPGISIDDPRMLGRSGATFRLDLIHAARPRTPRAHGWITYDGSRYTVERGYGWLAEVPRDPGGGADRGPDAAIVLSDGTTTSPRKLGRLELASWQGGHRENWPRVFRLDLPDGWYRVTCTSVDPGIVLPLVDVRSFKCRAHDAVFAGPRYGAPLRIKGAALVEGRELVEVTGGHLRVVVGDPAYSGWTWRYGGAWWRGWSAWFGSGGPHVYAEDLRGKLTRVVDPGFHSLRLNSLEVERVPTPNRPVVSLLRDVFNRDDADDVNSGLPAAEQWHRVGALRDARVTLHNAAMRIELSHASRGSATLLKHVLTPEVGLVRYSTSVTLVNGEGSRADRGRHEAGLVILANAQNPDDGTATVVSVMTGPGGGGVRIARLDGDVLATVVAPDLMAGEHEIVVDHDVGRNVLTRIVVDGRDLTPHIAIAARRPLRRQGFFGLTGRMAADGSAAIISQYYWFVRVDRVVAAPPSAAALGAEALCDKSDAVLASSGSAPICRQFD